MWLHGSLTSFSLPAFDVYYSALTDPCKVFFLSANVYPWLDFGLPPRSAQFSRVTN